MTNNKTLVIGGNGKTGRKVVERLTGLGRDVRVASRSAAPSFDWENPSNWTEVLAGVDSVYITFQPDLAVPGAFEKITQFTSEAVKSGVKKLVLLSGKGEKEAELCETAVMNSGADWTIVRASWFNQNFSEGAFLDSIMAGYAAMPKADAKIPFVDTDDIADVVVETLINDKHSKEVHELTGPRQLTFEQAVSEIANASGREIIFKAVTMEEYTAMLKEYNVPEDHIWLITYLFTEVLTPENSIVTNDVEKILGRRAKDFTEYARETALTGVWNQDNREVV